METNPRVVTTGALIRTARLRVPLSQKQLAQRLNVRQTTISRWERDEHTPTLGMRRQIAAALELPFDLLFREDAA